MTILTPPIIRGPILELELPASAHAINLIIRNNTTGKTMTLKLPEGWAGDGLLLDFAARTISDSKGIDRSAFVSPTDNALWTPEPLIAGVNDLELEARDGREGTGLVVSSVGPGTVIDDTSVGTKEWTELGGAKVEGGGEPARCNLSDTIVTTSHYIKATNYGLVLPDGGVGVTPKGVKFTVRRAVSGGGALDVNAFLVKAGEIRSGTTNKANGKSWSTEGVFELIDYGGTADLWGNSVSAADALNAGFGFALACKAPTTSGIAKIDAVKLALYYDFAPAATGYVAKGTVRFARGYV
jgi:hypothetical protein